MAGRQLPSTISTKRARIATLAQQMPETAIRSLSHHMDRAWLREAYRRTRKDGAVGVDGRTAEDYAAHLEDHLQQLEDRAKKGTYRAPPVRRVHIPKGGGKTRPIGITTFEDKILQRAVVMLLEPLYEQDFYDFSYGFRPGRSAHDALEDIRSVLWGWWGGWVLEVDIKSFFDDIDRKRLQEIVRQRVADGVVLRLIGKWLNAGVLEEGVVHHPESGTPQGGVISPLLANIYLHEVLDHWWANEVQPRMRGRAHLVRYADDFVIVFDNEDDARRVHEVLPKRMSSFGLTLHPTKTRLVRFTPRGRGPKPGSFDFLGFTHFWGRSRKGRWVPKRRTSKERLSRATREIHQWIRVNRHKPVAWQAQKLAAKLRGHFQYYGIAGNSDGITRFRHHVVLAWHKWLGRRSQRGYITVKRFRRILDQHPMPLARVRPYARQRRLANL